MLYNVDIFVYPANNNKIKLLIHQTIALIISGLHVKMIGAHPVREAPIN